MQLLQNCIIFERQENDQSGHFSLLWLKKTPSVVAQDLLGGPDPHFGNRSGSLMENISICSINADLIK